MNDIETLVRESMEYQGDLRPLSSEALIRRAHHRHLVRQAATVIALGAAAVTVVAVTTSWPQPSTLPVVVDPATSPSGGFRDELPRHLVAADSVQKQAFKDDRVTQDEYRTGFERYRACLSSAGYQMVSVEETGPVFDFSVPSEAVDSGADESCYTSHFKAVDMAWQLFHGDDIPQ